MILPVGLGIGATQPDHATMSPRRAAGSPKIRTVVEPFATIPGPLGTQLGIVQTFVMLVTIAASKLFIFTVGAVAEIIGWGMGGWARGVGTGAAGWMGA